MLARLRNMFRVPDLRNKILFTLLCVAAYRVGAHLPVPFVQFSAIKQLQAETKNSGVVGFLDLFSGGAITNIAIFFLGIMPYITASIIMQLLGVVIPKLEEWQNEGQTGQKKITQWTRYLTVGLALVQSTGFVFALHAGNGGLFGLNASLPKGIDFIPHFDAARAGLIVLTWVAGTALVMWLGELITQRGIGNGMSILIFASVVSRLPSEGGAIYAQGTKFQFFTILLIGIAMIVGIVFVESGQRRIPVQFAKRVVGRRMYGGQSTFIPLKVNQSGVIPVIFASSILAFPALIASALGNNGHGIQAWINNNLVQNQSWFYILFYTILIIFFAYFYTAIAFNPQQQADIIRKQGGFIPGIRPGPPTERYLAKTLNRITLPGSLFLATIAVAPLLAFALWNISQFPFGGTALLITVGVALETMQQIDSQLMMRNYEGFLT
jgi:preprotein translocase subunit SecY